MKMKLSMFAVLLAAAPAAAETVAPFPADDCNPGYTTAGEFVDGANRVLQQSGWVAEATNVVVTAEGLRVFLSEDCLQAYLANNDDTEEVSQGSPGLGVIGGVLLAALAAGMGGGSNGTSGTNGTDN